MAKKYQSDFFADLERMQQHFRDLVDPPALRMIREATEVFRNKSAMQVLNDYGAVASLERSLGLTQFSPLMREQDAIRSIESSFGGPKLRELLQPLPNVAFEMNSLIEHAGATLLSNAGICNLLQEVTQFELLSRTQISSLAVPTLAREIATASNPTLVWSQPAFRREQSARLDELLQASALTSDADLSDTAVSLVAEVAPETFLAVDIGATLSGVDVSQHRDIRETVTVATRDEVETHLVALDPAFVSMLHGARVSASTASPDSVRHVCVSLRELLSHVLHRLVPDQRVRQWSTAPEFYHQGRPTRAARLKCLLDDATCQPLTRFFAADIRAALDLLDGLNQATHEVLSDLTHDHISVIVTRVEGTLLVLLKINAIRRGVLT